MRRFVFFGILLCLLSAAGIQTAMAEALPGNYRLEPFARNLEDAESAAFATDGRIYVLERISGDVRLIDDGILQDSPFVTVSVATNAGTTETGLLGIALHPDFRNNGWVYLYYTQDLGGGDSTNRIVRYTASGNTGTNETIILDDIGVGPNGEDNGGALAFGPDGKLYATVGVMEFDTDAASFSSLGGKVLRLNDDGTVPADNPQIGLSYPYNLIYAWGFRNPAGVKFNDIGTLYVTDNTDDEVGVDCDEVNVVVEDLDYGWNTLYCGAPGPPPSPMQTIQPKTTAWDITPYDGDKFVATCGTDPSVECSDDSECNFCDNSSKSCAVDSDCYQCQHSSSVTCLSDADCGHCEDDTAWSCTEDSDCLTCEFTGEHCETDADCFFNCTVQDTCLPGTCDVGGTCPSGTCGDPSDYMFVAGKTGGIMRDVVSGTNKDELLASVDFYTPAGSCPTTVTSVNVGGDGSLYVTAADTDPGLYKVVYDTHLSPPRETSSTQYAPLTVVKNGDGMEFRWEDLKRDAWRCSEGRTYCSNEYLTFCETAADCPSGGTCDLRDCPAGSGEGKYTLWAGTLAAPLAYDHTVMAESNGTDSGDALVSHVESTMPADNKYFLVSARRANLEGSTGNDSAEGERPGYIEADRCEDIGFGDTTRDYELCFGDLPDAYADQNNKLWTMEDLRGKTLMFSAMQYG